MYDCNIDKVLCGTNRWYYPPFNIFKTIMSKDEMNKHFIKYERITCSKCDQIINI